MKFGRLIKCNKEKCNKLSQTLECALTLSWRRPLSYRNQSIDFQSKKTVSIQLFSLKIGWNFQNCSFTEHLRLRLLQKTNNSLTVTTNWHESFNPCTTRVFIISKPTNKFTVQIKWLVSIWSEFLFSTGWLTQWLTQYKLIMLKFELILV